MNYKKVSSFKILQEVLRDFKIQHGNFIPDAKEWIKAATEGIGYHANLITKNTPICETLTVKNHILCYPCDLHALLGVSYNGCRLRLGADISMGMLVSDEELQPNQQLNFSEQLDLTKKITLYDTQVSDLANFTPGTADYDAQIARIEDTLGDIKLIVDNMGIQRMGTGILNGHYYVCCNGYIWTSFKEGNIRLLYVAFDIDEEGMLRVVDTYKYRNAIKWFIMTMLIQQGYKHHTFSYQDCDTKWEIFREQASNEMKRHSLDARERHANYLSRVRINRDAYGDFFTNYEQPDVIDNSLDSFR